MSKAINTVPGSNTLGRPMRAPAPRRKHTVDIVGIVEIAQRLGMSRRSIETLRYRRQFPLPDWELATGPVWVWDRIYAWAESTNRLNN